MNRKFIQEVHDASDGFGKNVVMNWLKKTGTESIENPNKYGIDIMIPIFEVEHRTNWKGDTFPFNTIHVPTRKEKFNKPLVRYVVVNEDGSYIAVARMKDVVNSPIDNVKIKYSGMIETFYNVPITMFRIIKT